MKRGSRGDTLDDEQLDAGLDTPEQAIATGDPATFKKKLFAIGLDALKAHQFAAPVDGNQ
ncbi:hypothetical protein D3C81_1757320 [compost metagenome]